MEGTAPPSHHLRYQVALLVEHVVIAGVLVALGITFTVGSLGIVAGLAFVLFLAATSLSYSRRFGTEPIGKVRSGSVKLELGRIHILIVGNAMMGYLALLAILAPALTAPGTDPSVFFYGLVGFWILLALCFVVILLAGPRIRRESLAKPK